MAIKFKEGTTIRSKITNPTPGLTEGKEYQAIEGGFWQGPFITLINDRGVKISIYDPDTYLHTEDLKVAFERDKDL